MGDGVLRIEELKEKPIYSKGFLDLYHNLAEKINPLGYGILPKCFGKKTFDFLVEKIITADKNIPYTRGEHSSLLAYVGYAADLLAKFIAFNAEFSKERELLNEKDPLREIESEKLRSVLSFFVRNPYFSDSSNLEFCSLAEKVLEKRGERFDSYTELFEKERKETEKNAILFMQRYFPKAEILIDNSYPEFDYWWGIHKFVVHVNVDKKRVTVEIDRLKNEIYSWETEKIEQDDAGYKRAKPKITKEKALEIALKEGFWSQKDKHPEAEDEMKTLRALLDERYYPPFYLCCIDRLSGEKKLGVDRSLEGIQVDALSGEIVGHKKIWHKVYVPKKKISKEEIEKMAKEIGERSRALNRDNVAPELSGLILAPVGLFEIQAKRVYRLHFVLASRPYFGAIYYIDEEGNIINVEHPIE